MIHHGSWDEGLRARAEDYAAGRLSATESRTYESHLEECARCREEVAQLRDVLGGLALASPPAEPPADTWDRIQRAVADSIQTWRGWQADRADDGPLGLFLRRGGDAGWEATGAPGVTARQLFIDPPNDRVTMLVRMAPGSSYPAHRHGGPEECYVLEGDLQVGEELEMRAGDYQRAKAGTLHPVQSTRGGCLLLLQSSLSDELLA